MQTWVNSRSKYYLIPRTVTKILSDFLSHYSTYLTIGPTSEDKKIKAGSLIVTRPAT